MPRASVRHHLLRRIETRYRVVTEPVHVGTVTFPFTRIADPDHVLDDVAAEEDRLEKVSGRRTHGEYLRLPYWAQLWDSALAVAVWLMENIKGANCGRGEGAKDKHQPPPRCSQARLHPPSLVPLSPRSPSPLPAFTPTLRPRSPRVLDLGCGMGLSGTAAAALGSRVLFADLETPPLLFARLNSLPWAGRVRTRQLDWRTDQLGERFDLILGADILYERKQWEHLEPFWRAHLVPGGAVLLGEPGRPTGKAFPEWIESRGWTMQREEQPVATQPEPIQLFLLNAHNSAGGRRKLRVTNAAAEFSETSDGGRHQE